MESHRKSSAVNCSLFSVNNYYINYHQSPIQSPSIQETLLQQHTTKFSSEKSKLNDLLCSYQKDKDKGVKPLKQHKKSLKSVLQCKDNTQKSQLVSIQSCCSQILCKGQAIKYNSSNQKRSAFRKKISISRSSSKNSEQLQNSGLQKYSHQKQNREIYKYKDLPNSKIDRINTKKHKYSSYLSQNKSIQQSGLDAYKLKQSDTEVLTNYAHSRMPTQIDKVKNSQKCSQNKSIKLRKKGKNYSKQISWNLQQSLCINYSQNSESVQNTKEVQMKQQQLTNKLKHQKKQIKTKIQNNNKKSDANFLHNAKLVQSKCINFKQQSSSKLISLKSIKKKKQKNCPVSIQQFMQDRIQSRNLDHLQARKLQSQFNQKESLIYRHQTISIPYESRMSIHDLTSRYNQDQDKTSIINNDFGSYPFLQANYKQVTNNLIGNKRSEITLKNSLHQLKTKNVQKNYQQF